MTSYAKLLQVLNDPVEETLTAPPQPNSGFQTTPGRPLELELLIWNYKIQNREFRLLSSDFGYASVTTCDFKQFLKTIKPCFQDYFVDLFLNYIQFLKEQDEHAAEITFQGFFPVRLHHDEYFYCTLNIVPGFENHKVSELNFYLIPLKEYNNEVVSYKVLFGKDRRRSTVKKTLGNEMDLMKQILTPDQISIFQLVMLGYSSSRIASVLKKKRNNVLKYNIRIKERLSNFFDIEFDTVSEAAKYYKSCFIHN